MSALLVLIYSAALFAAGYQFRKHSEAAPGHDSHAIRVSMLQKM